MQREDLKDLLWFLAVVRERSFTKAAAELGTSQSTLSHTIKQLEARLGVRLLTRTTRSVAPTEAGERLNQSLVPRFEGIAADLSSLVAFRDKPAGTVRITLSDHALRMTVWPKLQPMLRDYPDLRVELYSDNGMRNIVEERFDAGVRLGESVDRDMIAVRIGPDLRMAVVGAPAYLKRRPAPKKPQDLTEHDCINLRLPTRGGIYAWEFEKRGREMKVRTEGRLVFNNVALRLDAVLAGFGLAYLPDDQVLAYLKNGRLVRVLEDWCPPFSGYHLYYPSRRQTTPAFALLVDALRFRG